MNLHNLISGLRLCYEPSSLVELEEEFNAVGLTVQMGQAGKIFLCQIVEGRPACDIIFEDYIPLCMVTDVLDDSVRNRAFEFIIKHVSGPEIVISDSGRDNCSLYGASLHDGMSKHESEQEIIDAIGEWIGFP